MSTNQDLNLSANGSGNVIFNTDSNTFVGVGTSVPQASLDIAGTNGTLPVVSVSGTTSYAGFAVNNSGVGSLFTASSSGVTRFTIGNDGTASISATTGSTYLKANGLLATTSKQTLQLGDQQTGNIQIGIGGSSSPSLLVLDNKNDNSSDPSGVNGAMYYNSSLDTFRCFKSGGWQNCGADVNKQQYAKSSDQSVTNSTTLTDESALQFTMGAGETWVFQYFLVVSNNNSAVPDWKAAIHAPGASSCDVTQSGAETAGAAFPQATTTDCTTPAALVDSAINASAIPFQVYIQGSVTDSGSGSTVTLQFAENTSGSGTSITIKKGSYVVAYKATGADLAEIYQTNDRTITAGDVVSIDKENAASVKKSVGLNDKNVLGIVSTQPGLVIGDNIAGQGMPVYLALSGRVPVKVSTESGEINPGDFLTTSTIPGYASKAVSGGRVIGQALSGSQTGGAILAFINNGFAPDSIFIDSNTINQDKEGLTFNSQDDKRAANINNASEQILKRIDSLEAFVIGIKNNRFFNEATLGASDSAIFENGLTSFGPATFGQVAITENLTIGGVSLTKNGINNYGQLDVQPYSQGNISFLNDKVVFDTEGNIQVKGNANFEKNISVGGEVEASSISLKQTEISYLSETEVVASASAGVLTVREGKPLTLRDLLIGKDSLLYLTPRTEIDAPIYISSQSAGMATIGVGKSTQKDVEVNFLIVNLRN